MSSPAEKEHTTATADLPSDFTRCVEKLLSSVSTLNKHLSILLKRRGSTTTTTTTASHNESDEELSNKSQAIKDAISSLAPAIETSQQLAPTSTLVQRLSSDYQQLSDKYKEYFAQIMGDTRSFNEYKQSIDRLATWLATTNANIHEVLQSVNKQRALLIIKNLDELGKYKTLLERATILNRSMVADLPVEQAKTMSNEIADVKEQWRLLIEGLNTLKERHASRYSSPEPPSDRFAQQNENLVHYIESWLTLAKQLIKQQEQLMINQSSMIDDNGQDPEQNNENFLYQLRECEQEIVRLKNLLEENCRQLNNNDLSSGEVTRSLADELTEMAQCLTTARIQIENRYEQQQGFLVELDSLIQWLNEFIDQSTHIDRQTIQLALKERQHHFEELMKCNLFYDQHVQEKIEHLIEMWHKLTSMLSESPTSKSPLLSDASIRETQSKLIDQAQEFLTQTVQLGNRNEIEGLQEKIRTFLNDSDVKSYLPDQVTDQLTTRATILEQMLIDTAHIDRLRVNFVAHFNTDTDVIRASNEINTIIDNYPREMTSEMRLWLNEQQTSRLTAPLATADTSKSVEDFQEYLKDLEENLRQYEQNSLNETKFQKLVQQMEERPNLPDQLADDDRQRFEHLKERFHRAQKQIEQIQKTEVDQIIDRVDGLLERLREVEEQIRANAIQPTSDYERLIFDCQRIQTELDRNLRQPVEQTINAGRRLYSTDNRDSSGVESADETVGITFSSSTSTSPSLKKHSDLSLRKVRRHVLQLTQRWKNANANIRHRLKVLQRIQSTVEEFRRKCAQLHSDLVDIELTYGQHVNLRTLTVEQVPAEIEQAKHLLNTLMSYKASIDDLQQSAQSIEGEYDIQAINRAQELQQRWEHSVTSSSQRIQFLQDSIKHSDHDIYSSSVEYPWQRSVAFNKVPYYINHSDQSTSWDHPKMLELIRSMSNLNDIRFSAYRTAMKLRTLQKRLCLDLTSLCDIISVFEDHSTMNSPNRNAEKYIDVTEILNYLQIIFDKTANEYPQMVNVILTVDLTLNWLLNIYDVNRTGSIRLLAMKMALALLCRGNIEEKYRYIFSLVAYPSTAVQDQRDVVDRQRLSILFQQAIVIPKQLGEVAAFGGSNVEPSVTSCFDYAHNPDVITADDFLEWVKLEPQSLVWLPVMHRLAASEAAKHEARCNICKIYPILGFRYRSLKHFNCDICQNCFFSGKQTKIFKMDDPLQEYYTETTSSEDIRDFFRIFKNKLWSKHRKHPKLGYLPLPHVFDNNPSSTSQSNPSSPILVPALTPPFKPDVITINTHPMPSAIESADEHGVIAQHCRNLSHFARASPRAAAHEILTRSRSLDNEQRNELEAIIRDLEDENRLLQNEYERLCHQHMEKSLRINEQLRTSDSQLGSLSILNEYNSSDREMLREAKQLRHHKTKLEQRMKILEDHNKQLEKQLKRSKQLLFRESPSLHHHTSNTSIIEPRGMSTAPSPLHSSTLGLRRSVERNLERQPNLVTIDNLFHMADDINRAVGDLVSVITEPQSNGSSYYPSINHSLMS